MPYIKEYNKESLKNFKLRDLVYEELNEGEINYIISYLLKSQFYGYPCYATINKLIGAIECAKQEFIRRYVNPYEDIKIQENGDI